MSLDPQAIGYGLAGVVFLILTLLLIVGYRRRPQVWALTIASLGSAVWGFGLANEAQFTTLRPLPVFVLEFAADLGWLLFLAALMQGALGSGRLWMARYAGAGIALGILLWGVVIEVLLPTPDSQGGAAGLLVTGSLITSLCGLVMLEQIYRNAREPDRPGLNYLCIGVGGSFAYDLMLYSNATILGDISGVMWDSRGFVVTLCAPFIAVAMRRATGWSVGIFVSRQIVFYGATLTAAGIYLTLVAFIGYYIRTIGGQWGSVVQLVFIAAATLALGVILFSAQVRARIRVFISKHFYENKYDYREEWLGLIATLTDDEDGLPLRKRGIKALAQILDAPSGLLFLQNNSEDEFHCVSSWNTRVSDFSIAFNDTLPSFLRRTGWVIERCELESSPGRYEGLTPGDLPSALDHLAFVVPLSHDGLLLGFVCLAQGETPVSLNFEDRDLLKTAGQQIASYLAQEIATEQLTESRQFEAYNKLTAYIMHDLKNLIAQQTLVVENAQKHKDKPEFIDDAIDTIRGSVTRMRRVIETLQQSSQVAPAERVELGKLIMQSVSQCCDRNPVPHATIGDEQVWVRANRDRLQMAVYHAIRNAQDATPADGDVSVQLVIRGNECSIRIADSGRGMDEDFVRERLFKPFDSTKGTSGMGIGAYQIRETLLAEGGHVDVKSTPGQGTTVSLRLDVER